MEKNPKVPKPVEEPVLETTPEEETPKEVIKPVTLEVQDVIIKPMITRVNSVKPK
jgi:hypothetical protein